jgi:hypothetical protein
VSGIHGLSDLRRLLTPLGKSMDPCQPLAADSWKEREACLSRAHEAVAAMQNELRVTPPLETGVTPFHGRPYLVLHAERFAAALEDAVGDPRVQALPRGVGSADQIPTTPTCSIRTHGLCPNSLIRHWFEEAGVGRRKWFR